MKKLTLLLAIGASGCLIHKHVPTNAPGHVALDTPPRDLALRAPEPPVDPGEEVTVVTAVANPLGVGWTSVGTGEARTYMPFSLEVAASRHTLRESHRNMVAGYALDGAFRPNLGLTFLRVFPGRDKVDVGPTFLELQYVGIDPDRFFAGTFALGVATTFRRVGPQATACVGSFVLFDLCVRANHLFGEGTSLQFTIGYQGAYESIVSR